MFYIMCSSEILVVIKVCMYMYFPPIFVNSNELDDEVITRIIRAEIQGAFQKVWCGTIIISIHLHFILFV